MSAIQTKKEIALSFRRLIEDKPIDSVTVGEIAKGAGINRQSFYYHFKDVQDLVSWICFDDAKDATPLNENDTWQANLIVIAKELKKDGLFVDRVYHSINLDLLNQFLFNVCSKVSLNMVSKRAKHLRITLSEEDIIYISRFYNFAFTSTLLYWIKYDMQHTPVELADSLSKMVDSTLDHAIKNYGKRKFW